jgi:hypothetical protein
MRIKNKDMEKQELERAGFAFRWNCKSSAICTKLDKTAYPASCFANDCKTRSYKCDGSCAGYKNFMKMLKEPYE